MAVHIPELLIPAGNMLKLKVALAYGADAVYVGAAQFSMRPNEAAMNPEQLEEAVICTHKKNKKLYVGLNTLMNESNIEGLDEWIKSTAHIPFDAVIVSDPGILTLMNKYRPEVEIHISTQLSTANHYAAKFWQDAGASRVVLAREASIDNAKAITDSGVETEVFIHGAMCIAYSGRCLLSAHLTGKSGNKGECKHSCRWDWQLVESKRPGDTIPVFETGKETIFLGSTDLCLIEHLPLLITSGITSLKVEGRMKGEYYLGVITRTYRDALDAYAKSPGSYTINPQWLKELNSVSHRPYDSGFAFGYPENNSNKLQTNSTVRGTYDVIALVTKKQNDSLTFLVKNPFEIGDSIEWIGPNGTAGTVSVDKILDSYNRPRQAAHPGTTVTVICSSDISKIPPYALLRRKHNFQPKQ